VKSSDPSSPGVGGLTDGAPSASPDLETTYEARRGRYGVLRESLPDGPAPPAGFYASMTFDVRRKA